MLARTVVVLIAMSVPSLNTSSHAAPDEKDTANKKFIEALQGEWQMVSDNEDGELLDNDFVKRRKIVYKGDSYTVYKDGKEFLKVNIKVDASKTPVLYDTVVPGHSTQNGIIKIDGDTLTVCFGPVDGERATEFKSPKGKGWDLIVYKRVVKK